MKPTVGRIVHYKSYGTPGGEFKQECRAAIVTQNTEGFMGMELAGLAVMNPTGMFFQFGAPEDSAGCASEQGGTWHWPDRN